MSDQSYCFDCRARFPATLDRCPSCGGLNTWAAKVRGEAVEQSTAHNVPLPREPAGDDSLDERSSRRSDEPPASTGPAWMAAVAAFLIVAVVVLGRISPAAGGVAALVGIPVAAFLAVAWWFRDSS